MPNLRSFAGNAAKTGIYASILYEAGKAIRSISPFDPKNQAAARRSDPNAQPLRTMTAEEMRNAPRLEQYNPDAVKPKPPSKATTKPVSRATPKSAQPARSANASSGSSRPSIRAAASAPKKPQPGQSKDMNENYQMWAKANPALAAKVKSNQSGYNAFAKDAVAGVGPVKDGSSYKPQAEKTSEMNASAVRRAALSASAGSVTEPKIAQTPNKKKKVNG
jgi:hypothetical protein